MSQKRKESLRELRTRALAQYQPDQPIDQGKIKLQRLHFLLEKSAAYVSFVTNKLNSTPSQQFKRKQPQTIEGCEVSDRQPQSVTGGVMREYQLEGMEWLASLYENGLNGILADEMGLGKTLQTIAFLCFLRERQVWGPFLVLCPLSTLSNWASEFFRFAPTTPVLVYHGTPEERKRLRSQHLRTLDSKFPIVLTTYEISMRDKQPLQRFAWKFIIVDEGHRIKNMNCRLIRDLKAYQSANRLLLTGTPLQNSLSELWSLLNFLLPDIFDDLESFQQWFDFDDLAQQEGQTRLLSEQKHNSIVSKLHNILQPFLLRRLKVDVEKYLPPKREYLVACPMAPQQYQFYQAVRGPHLREFLKDKLIQDEDIGQIKAESQISQMNLQFRLMQQRKVCQHPYLFDFPVLDPTDPESALRIDEELVRSSGKLLVLDRLLPRLFRDGHRVLVFSQFAKLLDILECYAELRGWKYCRIDGSVGQADRQDRIVRFNTHPNIPLFFLTTRSGGLGINLTSADTVVLFDSDWNPQQDLQAQDRVHRIGQLKPVLVYRLVIAGSCERAMLERANAKRKLEKLVIHQKKFKGPDSAGDLSVGEVRDILNEGDTELVQKDQSELGKVLEKLGPNEMLPEECVLTEDELAVLTDRTTEAYKRKEKDTSSRRFTELDVVPDERNDILAANTRKKN